MSKLLSYLSKQITSEPWCKGDPRIPELFKQIDAQPWPEEFRWCAAFVGSALKNSGYDYVPGQDGALARSYINYGESVETPQTGDIAVIEIPGFSYPHVAFVWTATPEDLVVLGGAQMGGVALHAFPVKNVLAIRRPRRVE